MTVKNFITYLEEYYGEKCQGLVRDVMLDYLSGCSEAYLKAALAVLFKRVSRRYGKLPDIADLTALEGEIAAHIPRTPRLPEMPAAISEADRQEVSRMLSEWKRKLAGGRAGPLAGRLSKAVSNAHQRAGGKDEA